MQNGKQNHILLLKESGTLRYGKVKTNIESISEGTAITKYRVLQNCYEFYRFVALVSTSL